MTEIIDVAHEKEIALALKRNEQLFSAAIENYPYTVVVYNHERQIEYINGHGLASLGIPLDRLIGKQAEDIDIWQTTQSLPLLLKVYETKQQQKAEVSFIVKKKELYYHISYVPILDEDTNVCKVFGIMQDVTAERRLEQYQLRKRDLTISDQRQDAISKQHELDDSRRLSHIGSLAATVAHELRNPLGVIRTAVYNLRRKNKDPDLISHLDNIDKKVIESDRIIANLLNYARPKVPHFEKVDLLLLIEETMRTIQKQYQDYPINLISDLTDQQKIWIEADPFQITEVMVNLIENAYQAIGPTSADIRMTVVPSAERVTITIYDSGPGIREEDLEHIFIPFFTRKPKGTGLGLPICLELVRLHHGDIEVKSTENDGCTFIVNLPLMQSHD